MSELDFTYDKKHATLTVKEIGKMPLVYVACSRNHAEQMKTAIRLNHDIINKKTAVVEKA
jgi:hypothetical protein